jgi:hypothetical protein
MPRTRRPGNDHPSSRNDFEDTYSPGPVRHLKGEARPGTALAAVRGRTPPPPYGCPCTSHEADPKKFAGRKADSERPLGSSDFRIRESGGELDPMTQKVLNEPIQASRVHHGCFPALRITKGAWAGWSTDLQPPPTIMS